MLLCHVLCLVKVLADDLDRSSMELGVHARGDVGLVETKRRLDDLRVVPEARELFGGGEPCCQVQRCRLIVGNY